MLNHLVNKRFTALILAAFSLGSPAQENLDGKYTTNKVFQLLEDLGPGSMSREAPKAKYFAINLNPFVVTDYQTNGSVFSLNESVFMTDNSLMSGKENIGVQLVADEISRMYGVKFDAVSSLAGLTLYVKMNIEQARSILEHKAVSSIEQIRPESWLDIETNISQSLNSMKTSFMDIIDNHGETTSWAKRAVNADSGSGSLNNFYLVDGNFLDYSSIAYDVNIIEKFDTNTDAWDAGSGRNHSYHIAGLVGARANGRGVVGINPGQPLKTFGISPFRSFHEQGNPNAITQGPGSVIYALNLALMHAEDRNEFAVLNLSANFRNDDGISPHLQPLAFNQHLGVRLRIASNRFMITQSAGNMRESERWQLRANSCARAYHYQGGPRENDGIIVAGGIDQQGAVAIDDAGDESSTYGSCVEAWAPAKDIISFDKNGWLAKLTGTSFAAPITAAIASRYGNAQTRPIEREAYIMKNLRATGFTDPSGRAVRKVFYTSPRHQNIPEKINARAITATGPNIQNLQYVTDGKFISPNYWNANSPAGSVIFDLGSRRKVTGIRLTMRSSAPPQTPNPIDFKIFTSDYVGMGYMADWQLQAQHTEPYQADLAPVYVPVNATGRYFMIDGINHGSWLAYSEIEFYGH